VTAPRRGIPFVVSAPSGAGKTTVLRAILVRDPELVVSVSHTTRRPRPGERDGVDYHFVSEDEFRRLVAKGAFLEHAVYSGHLYGTSWAAIEAPLAHGSDVLLEIETEGARQVRARRADARLVFLLPPSLAALESRLRGRGTDDPAEIARRLAIARGELAAAPLFEAFVVNENVEQAAADLLEIVGAARAGRFAEVAGRFSLSAVRPRLDAALADSLAGSSGAPPGSPIP
jgi:guanylate kinase